MAAEDDSGEAESNSERSLVHQLGRLGLIFIVIMPISIGIAAFLTWAYGQYVYVPSRPNQRLDIFLGMVALAANVALSGGLLLVYLNQNNTLEREAKILEGQQELMREQMKPAIEPYELTSRHLDSKDRNLRESAIAKISQLDQIGFAAKLRIDEKSRIFELGDPHTESETIGEDELRFKLANTGHGIAKDFRLRVRLRILDNDSPYRGAGARIALHRLDRLSIHKYAENTMKAGQEDVEFASSIELGIFDSSDNYTVHSFSDAVGILTDAGTNDIVVTFELQYNDIFSDSYKNQIYSHMASIEPGMSLTQFMQADSLRMTFVNEHANED